jgi:hypothetical protein
MKVERSGFERYGLVTEVTRNWSALVQIARRRRRASPKIAKEPPDFVGLVKRTLPLAYSPLLATE